MEHIFILYIKINFFMYKTRTKKIKKRNKRITLRYGGNKDNFDSGYKSVYKEPFSINKPIEGGGVFCYMPYDALDKTSKSIFKIEGSNNIEKSIKELKKYYPTGFYVTAILTDLIKNKKKEQTRIGHYQLIIKRMIKNLVLNRMAQVQKEYEDGWVYCSEKSIHDEFNEKSIRYKCNIHIYNLSGINKDTMKKIDEKQVVVPTFSGKLVFHT